MHVTTESDSPQSAVPAKKKLVFLVGRGRSGTSLLQNMLSGNPHIAAAPESLFVMYLKDRYSCGPWNEDRIRAFHRDLWRETRMAQLWQLNAQAVLEALLRRGSQDGFAGLCETVYECYASSIDRPNARILVDKNPGYSLFVESLSESFPAARFIHLVRDPRANVASFRHVKFDANDPSTLAFRWRDYNAAILRAKRNLDAIFMTLRYEDLVGDPSGEIQRICDFLGVPFETDMLQPNQVTGQIGQFDWHQNLNKDITANHVEKWRQETLAHELRMIDSICSDVARQFDYDLSEDGLSVWQRLRVMRGAATAKVLLGLERLVFRIPLSLRAGIIDAYRWLTGSSSSEQKTNQ